MITSTAILPVNRGESNVGGAGTERTEENQKSPATARDMEKSEPPVGKAETILEIQMVVLTELWSTVMLALKP